MSNTLTKDDLGATLFAMGLAQSKSQGEKIVGVLFAQIANGLTHGKTVKLTKTGSLRVVDVADRERRNPRTGETFTQPAHKVVKFKASKVLKEGLAA